MEKEYKTSCVKAVSEMPEVQAISEVFCVSVVLGMLHMKEV